MNRIAGKKNHVEHLLIPAAIILAAFLFRVAALNNAPPGLTHDEAAHLNDAQRIVDGYRPIYLTTAYGREPLYDYVSAPFDCLFGLSIKTGRLVSALWGTGLVALVYALCITMFDRPTAILSAFLIAVSFWPVATSREILRSVSMPVLLTAAVLLFWKSVYSREKRRWILALSAGLIFGLGFYTYMPARITWLIPIVFGLSLAITDKPRWKICRGQLVVIMVTMLLVAGPLLFYLQAHPELEVRVDELSAPIKAALEGNPGRLLRQIKETVLLFSHKGDVQWIYNISGRPLLPPVLSVLFYTGIVLSIYRFFSRTKPAYRLVLIWLVLGVSPALFTGLESSSLRAIASQPVVYVLIALPAAFAINKVWPKSGSWVRGGIIAILVLLGVVLARQSAQDYFVNWANHRDTRVAYHSHLLDIGRYLDASPQGSPVTISTLYPGPFHDPYAFKIILERKDLDLFWHDGEYSLVFPDSETARAISGPPALIDPTLMSLIRPSITSIERIRLRDDDLVPWVEIDLWSPRRALEDLDLDNVVNVGDTLLYLGYRLSGSQNLESGASVDLVTFWEPAQTTPVTSDLVIFTHLLDAKNKIIAQQDRLDVPVSSWEQSMVFAQLHRLQIPADCPEGDYILEIGVYSSTDGDGRLPIIQDGIVIDDKIQLPQTVEIHSSLQ